MSRLYVTPLPDAQASTSDEGVRAQIQQSGLLQEGGTATEKIAQENIDLALSGEFEYGAKFSDKLADELSSLGESKYSGLPYYDTGSGRNEGYYEVEQISVKPVHPVSGDAYTYTVALTFTGTHETHWRAVETNVEDVQTGLATGSGGLIGIPATASKVRWYGTSSGKENASSTSTVAAEFGSLDLYDPDDTSIVNPILLYEIPYGEESPVDVRVFDDRGLPKYYSVSSDGTTVEANQWTHAYHTAYEFTGDPVVDNGLLRLRFDESNGIVEAYEWNDGTSTWDAITVTHGDYQLIDADFEQISPADVRVFTEWYDTVDDRLEQAVIVVQRGLNRAIARYPPDTTQTSGLESVLDSFVGSYSTDVKPTSTLKARGEVK